jgi:glycyl-tRNA synthetase
MKKHQRYFPIEKDGELLPYFIAVRNGGEAHLDIVRMGNEQVIRARFADAAYFIQRDLEYPLEAYVPQLTTLTFQTKLGSMRDKVERLERLVKDLGQEFDLTPQELQTVERAAQLSKADLATLMVVEMTSLQGEMGRQYALHSGESPPVANAIYEHYLPRFAGDHLPETRPGWVLSLADRLDSLMGLFAAGIHPTGTRDPYGLRRSAIGLLQLLLDRDGHFDLRRGLELAARHLPFKVSDGEIEQCLAFIQARLQVQLLSEGMNHDVVEAVLVEQGRDPVGANRAAEMLERWTDKENWPETLQSYARCARIVRDQTEQFEVDPELFVEEAEKQLHRVLLRAEDVDRSRGSVDDFFAAFLPMVDPITQFFDEVLVMTKEEGLRRNRLGLLQRIVRLAEGVADLSKLEGF